MMQANTARSTPRAVAGWIESEIRHFDLLRFLLIDALSTLSERDGFFRLAGTFTKVGTQLRFSKCEITL